MLVYLTLNHHSVWNAAAIKVKCTRVKICWWTKQKSIFYKVQEYIISYSCFLILNWPGCKDYVKQTVDRSKALKKTLNCFLKKKNHISCLWKTNCLKQTNSCIYKYIFFLPFSKTIRLLWWLFLTNKKKTLDLNESLSSRPVDWDL